MIKKNVVFLLFIICLISETNCQQIYKLDLNSNYCSKGRINDNNFLAFEKVFFSDHGDLTNALMLKNLTDTSELKLKENINIEFIDWYDNTKLVYIERTHNFEKKPSYSYYLNIYDINSKYTETYELPVDLYYDPCGYIIKLVGDNLIVEKSYSKDIFNHFRSIETNKTYSFNIFSKKITCINSYKKLDWFYLKELDFEIKKIDYRVYFCKKNKIKFKTLEIEIPFSSDYEIADNLDEVFYCYKIKDTSYLFKYNIKKNTTKLIYTSDRYCKIHNIYINKNRLLLDIVNENTKNPIEITQKFNDITLTGILEEKNIYLLNLEQNNQK